MILAVVVYSGCGSRSGLVLGILENARLVFASFEDGQGTDPRCLFPEPLSMPATTTRRTSSNEEIHDGRRQGYDRVKMEVPRSS
jgi:hypothetical protein